MTEPVLLGGRYRLEEIIGRGGMAEVWRARDERLDRLVAVKRLRVDLATDHTFQLRFQREAQSAAGLNHPNIVSVYDTGEKVDPASGISVPYIVMELVEGHTLRELLQQGPLSPAQAFEYEMGVLDALSYSHKHDIVHRDIKPANVMITPAGRVKVMDFGIARAVSDTSATMTQTAAVIGTAQYLSPEQARGETVDARSDIYSAGCLLYEMLTGRPPFLGDSPVSVAYQHVREMPIPPSQLDAEITPEMDAVTMKALAKATDDRYQSAKEMRDDCWRLLNGQHVTARIPAVVAASDPNPGAAPTRALPIEDDPDYDATAETFFTEDEVVEPDARQRRVSPATVVLIGLLVLLLAALGLFAWRLMAPDPKKNDVQVPSVVGFLQEAAVETLTLAQLTPKVERVAGPAEGKGTVIKQDPEGGTSALVGSTVTITINDGPPVSTIPQGLVGKQQDEAIALLKQAGFTKIEPLPAPADLDTVNAKPGEVVRVVPEQGMQVSTDQQVTLYVATGRATMPSVVDLTEADARKALTEAGFTNVVVGPLGYDQAPQGAVAGTVIRTSPEAGQPIGKSDKITIYVATRKAAVPAVTGMSEAEAKTALGNAGFKNVVVTDDVTTDPTKIGKVLLQAPVGGSEQVVDDPISIVIGTAAAPTPPPTTAPTQPSEPTTGPTTAGG